MGKFKYSTKASRTRSKAKNFGHKKTSFGGKHVKVTVGTKGIHTSIKLGPITYKPSSGRYSIKTPIKGLKYTGKTTSSINSKPRTYSNGSYTNNTFKQYNTQTLNETQSEQIDLNKLIKEYKFTELNDFLTKYINECAEGLRSEEDIRKLSTAIKECDALTDKELANNYAVYYRQFKKNRDLTNYIGLYLTYLTIYNKNLINELPKELRLEIVLRKTILDSDYFMEYCLRNCTHQNLVYQARLLATRLRLPIPSKDLTIQELKAFILRHYLEQ